MTQDDVIRIAKQTASHGTAHPCGDTIYHFYYENLALFADQILEEVAQEIAKLPFGDTASSFAVFVRQMKVNRSDNESGRSPLSATSTSAE